METKINQSNAKVIFWVIICVSCTACFIYTIDYILVNHIENGYNPTKILRYKNFNIIIFSLGSIFCSIGAIAIGTLFFYRVCITINKDGFTYDGGVSSSFYIPWRNVVKIENVNVNSAKMIKVYVKNKEDLGLYKNKRYLKWISSHIDHVTISSAMFKIKHQDLVLILNKYWDEWKKNNEKEN